MQNAFAAFRDEDEWMPLTSIRNDPEAVEHWINKTYMSGAARQQFKVVKIRVKILSG
jgi:hypothetical protein